MDISIQKLGMIILIILLVVLVATGFQNYFGDVVSGFVGSVSYPSP